MPFQELNKDKLDKFVNTLIKFNFHKEIELRFIRLYSPALNDFILAQFLSYNTKFYSFS
jgi:hypothetical protein